MLKATLQKAKLTHKTPCKHDGGIIDPDDCIRAFVANRNEEKVFVGTQDNDLRNELRNMGTVPLFFFRQQVLIMDTPSEQFQEKMALKEKLKLEPTMHEKAFLKSQREIIERVKQEQLLAEKNKRRDAVKDLYVMGIKKKIAKGPNPLSMKKKQLKVADFPGKIAKVKKRRLRKGKRSRELSQQKKAAAAAQA